MWEKHYSGNEFFFNGVVVFRTDNLSSVYLVDRQEAFKGVIVLVSYVFHYGQSEYSALIPINFIGELTWLCDPQFSIDYLP